MWGKGACMDGALGVILLFVTMETERERRGEK